MYYRFGIIYSPYLHTAARDSSNCDLLKETGVPCIQRTSKGGLGYDIPKARVSPYYPEWRAPSWLTLLSVNTEGDSSRRKKLHVLAALLLRAAIMFYSVAAFTKMADLRKEGSGPLPP